jgi:pSer/pThr/pTyr-binding forkhead associated (FHA) protein
MKIWLHASLPLNETREILIDHFPYVVGRRSDSDCPLPFAFISRQHCQFTLDGSQVLVQDLESHNGTLVNGRQASTPLAVSHGDEIFLGPISFRVAMQPTPQETMDSQPGSTHEEAPSRIENFPHHPTGSKG